MATISKGLGRGAWGWGSKKKYWGIAIVEKKKEDICTYYIAHPYSRVYYNSI